MNTQKALTMKPIIAALAFSLTTAAFAQEVTLKDFNNWKMTEVTTKGHTKESLFKNMNRNMIKLGASICSNRALVWAYDFKRFQNIDSGKIFLFYTKKTGDVGQTTWWYHVSPVINEKGTIYALDAGFPGGIDSPLTTGDWLKKFSGSRNCKEIQQHETDLVQRMFKGYVYPETTSYGTYDCYYKITPGAYWTPSTIAQGLLGVDHTGSPVPPRSEEIDPDEVKFACVEAVTSPVGRVLGGGRKKCSKYLGL